MALVPSSTASQTSPDDEEDFLRQSVECYRDRVLLAKKMKKVLQSRLYLATAVDELRLRPSFHANLTKLELGLNEATGDYRRLVATRQLMNSTIQTGIQSTILYTVKKDVFAPAALNAIEAGVAQRMLRMDELSRSLRQLKADVDAQRRQIEAKRANLAAGFGGHAERLREAAQPPSADADLMATMEKKIRNVNILATLMSTLASQNATVHPRAVEAIQIVRKWRTPRSFDYYKAKCAQD